MNLPNLITSFRIIAAFVFLYFSALENWDLAFPVFFAAALTDLVDGSLARLLRQRTRLGAFLDPTADKLLMFFGFVTLTVSRYLPFFLTTLVIARDLFIVFGLRHLLRKKVTVVYQPTYLSKITTFLQIVTLSMALFLTQSSQNVIHFRESLHLLFDHFQVVIFLTASLTLITGFQYWRIGRKLIRDLSY